MSALAVAKKDLRSVRRSRGLWVAATVLALGTAVAAYGYSGYELSATETVTALFATMSMALGLLLPIVALVPSYLAIAGERRGGGIKFLLGLPNTRRDVFVGKLASRLTVVAGAVAFMFATAASVAAAKHGVLPPRTVLGLFGLALVYAGVFVAVAIALSAGIAARSRAIAAAFGSYFVLVILFVVPGVRITSIVAWVHATLLGREPNPNLYDALTYVSPYVAFQKARNLVVPSELERTVFRRSAEAGDLPAYLTDEVSLVVFAAWLAVPLGLGYLRFARADLE